MKFIVLKIYSDVNFALNYYNFVSKVFNVNAPDFNVEKENTDTVYVYMNGQHDKWIFSKPTIIMVWSIRTLLTDPFKIFVVEN